MKLKNKALIGIGLIWILFLIMTYTGSTFFLMQSFLELEKHHANRDLARIDQALDQINYSLYTFTSDWSHWNYLYDYMQGKNPAFVSNNLSMTAYVNSTINLLTYWDNRDNLVVGSAIDTDKKQLVGFQKGLEKYIYHGSPLLKGKDIRGYLLVENGIMMVSASAITEGDKQLPPLGTMVTARFISPRIIKKMGSNTQLDLLLLPLNQVTPNPALNKIFQTITSNHTDHYNAIINENNLEGYTIIRDIFNKPIGMLKMMAPRTIYLMGIKTIRYYLIAFVLLGTLFSLILLGLLRKLIIHKEHLDRLAHYDTLTSLPNRVYFNEILKKTLSHASRHHKILAILFIDLDRFKMINDTLGHTIGDLTLKEIANRFSKVLRAEDVIARLGGDEFIVLLNDINHPKYASPVAKKLLQACAEPIKINSHEFFITASIGICIFPNDGISSEDLQKNADMAMYKIKSADGNNFQYFTQEMNSEARDHIKLETALRKAVTNNEFILFYQPKFSLANGHIIGVEALIRWDNPEIGLVNPNEFIPLVEETGLIIKMGEWVLYEAARANKSWQNQGYQPISVAVNLSPKQFYHQDIAKLVKTVLTKTKLDPQYFELEITENAVMKDIEKTTSKLNDIRDMGVSIAIDDFGTGYTALNYLKQFPISVIKIDQSFIKGIPQNQNDISITSAIIILAHNLGIKVVAEGVETADQLHYLTTQNCDIVQGFYLSKPLPEEQLLLQLPKVSAKKVSSIPSP